MSMGDSTKTKSKTNNTIDPWSKGLIESAFNPALDLIGQAEMTPYTGELGADLDPLQLQAAQMAQGNIGAGQGQLGQATDIAGGVAGYRPVNVQAGQLAGMDYGQYMNPYLDAVLGSTLGAIDRQRQMALVGNSQAAGPGAWGGSRHGVADSLTNEAALREASSAANSIYSQGFGQAQQAGQFDINAALQGDLANQNAGLQGAGLNLNAANSLAGFGQQQQNMGLADVNAINAFGQQAQATQQNQNTMNYDEFNRQQQYPFLQAGAYGSLLGGVPAIVDSKSTSKTSQSPGLLSYLSAGAGLASSLMGMPGGSSGGGFSDRRLKKDIEPALTDGKGRQWYDFRYVWQDDDEPKQRGVMAQEILATDPHAVSTDPASGYLKVDYGALA